MGESSCVFQDFSLGSQPSTSEKMASALSALSESASFGRFLSESLDWGRWSSFNQKKYIEEAEMYSQRGSVAEKKAFFEARYKKASHLRRSVALMEHTASSSIDDFDRESAIDHPYSKDDSVSRGREMDESTIDSFYSANGDSVNFESREEAGEVEVEKCEMVEDSGFVDSCLENIVMPNTPAKKPLQESSLTNQPRNDSTEKITRTLNLESTKIPKPSFSPSLRSNNKAAYIHHTKENISSSSRFNSEGSSVERKRSTPKSVQSSTNHPAGAGSTPSKADVKTKIARFEAVSKSTQSPMFGSKATKTGFPKLVPKFSSQTPQAEHKKTAWDRRLTLSGRKIAAVRSGYSSTESPRGASKNDDTFQGEYTVSFNRKSEKKEENMSSRGASKNVDRFQGEYMVSFNRKNEKKEGNKESENDLREFRRSLCFKARPLPDFYRKTESTKESNKKITPMWSRSPVSTRISSSKEKQSQNAISVSSQKPPLSRSSSSRNSTAAPKVASFSKEQNNKWTFTFSRR